MTKRLMAFVGAAGFATALLSAGCGNDTTTPATTTPTKTSPVTETFTSIVSPLGAVSRSFTMTDAGTISVTLATAGPPPTVVMGLGLGYAVSPGGCSLTTVVNTAAGPSPQITTTADAGDYCVAILDVGNAPKTGISFSISILHP